MLLSLFSITARADTTSAFKIYGKTTSVLDIAKENQGDFFDLEKKIRFKNTCISVLLNYAKNFYGCCW